MFDWVFNILYSLTKVLLKIIDLIMQSCNKISGIEDITFEGNQTDFITYLIKNDKVTYAFGIASILGIILIVLFAIIQIIMTYVKDKNEETPQQIAKKAFKNIIILILVPTFMYAFIILTNAFVKAMYQATMEGTQSLPQFMFSIFGADATSDQSVFESKCMWNYSNGNHWDYLDMKDFDYFYSYIIGGLVVYMLLGTALMLVERAISIVLLYIVSPFVVASSVFDDGAKFKMWRDQVLIKFLTGHGAILAINIYMMVVGMITKDSVRFFENDTLNNFLKLLFIVGGALGIKQVQAIVGNLIQTGAGDKAVAENAQTTGKMGGFLKGAGSFVASPFKLARGIANIAKDSSQYGFGSWLGHTLGFKNNRDYGKMTKLQEEQQQRMHANQAAMINKPDSNGSIGEKTMNAIEGNNQNNNGNNTGMNDNANNNNVARPGEQAINRFLSQPDNTGNESNANNH